MDRVIASRFGARAAELLKDNKKQDCSTKR